FAELGKGLLVDHDEAYPGVDRTNAVDEGAGPKEQVEAERFPAVEHERQDQAEADAGSYARAARTHSTVTTSVRRRGFTSHSRCTICCQVPNTSWPARIGTVSEG